MLEEREKYILPLFSPGIIDQSRSSEKKKRRERGRQGEKHELVMNEPVSHYARFLINMKNKLLMQIFIALNGLN